MFVKLTRSGPRTYVKLVEAYRDEHGVSRQRVVATLGRLEQVRAGGADALIRGLHRVTCGQEPQAPSVRFAPALAVGDTWMLHALWHKLAGTRRSGASCAMPTARSTPSGCCG